MGMEVGDGDGDGDGDGEMEMGMGMEMEMGMGMVHYSNRLGNFSEACLFVMEKRSIAMMRSMMMGMIQ